MTAREGLAELLDRLDEELAEGLREALETDPEAVREYLEDEGFIEALGDHSEPELTDAEEALLDVLEGLGNPKSTSEIQEIVKIEYPEKLEEYHSLDHRSWISDKLNSLARKGYVGKYREGREVKFTPDPTEAVRRWALHNNTFASELTRSDAEEISADTGMRLTTVRAAVRAIRAEE